MRRIFWLLAAAAAVGGVLLLSTDPNPGPTEAGARGLASAPLAYGGWAIGLVMGLVLAWFATIEWRGLPARIGVWFKLQRRRLAWAVFGGLFASILLFF